MFLYIKIYTDLLYHKTAHLSRNMEKHASGGEGRKKYRSGTFFNFMSLRGTAHKGAQTPPLYEFPA